MIGFFTAYNFGVPGAPLSQVLTPAGWTSLNLSQKINKMTWKKNIYFFSVLFHTYFKDGEKTLGVECKVLTYIFGLGETINLRE